MDKTVTIFGRAGGFGRLFANRLEHDGYEVLGIDTQPSGIETCIDRCDTEAVDQCLKRSDMVLFCIPESTTINELPHVAKTVNPGTLLVDIASVKSNVFAVGETEANKHELGYTSIHPMFAPDHGFAGGNVVFIDGPECSHSKSFRQTMESWGIVAHDMSAAEHDQATQMTQVACHAAVLSFLQVASQSNLGIESLRKVETPLSKALMSLAARIVDNDPMLFLSIQKNNTGDGRQRLGEAIKHIEQLVQSESSDGWIELIESMKDWLGEFKDQYVQHFPTATKSNSD